jgi:hypothetical protein
MDRRLTPATKRVAHVSLKGRIEAEVWTEGETLRVQSSIVDLLQSPNGPRERQLLLGDEFTVIDREGEHGFGFAVKDGYCGWLPLIALAEQPEPTHWVASAGTHRYGETRVQRAQFPLPMGAKVRVSGQEGKWAQVDFGYVPASHLRAMGDWFSDPVAVAEGFLGTPYLWGGNSREGIDCSGLVQAAFAACGIGLPADSDLQEGVGREVQGAPRRGDLLFWEGHVALVVDGLRLIHANGFTMSVAYEGLDACIARIAETDGPVTARRRLE